MTSGVSSNCKSDYSAFCGSSFYPKSPLVPAGDGVKTGTKIWPQTTVLLPALPGNEQPPDCWPWSLPAAAKADSSAGRLGAQTLLAFPCRTYQGLTSK